MTVAQEKRFRGPTKAFVKKRVRATPGFGSFRITKQILEDTEAVDKIRKGQAK
ncbi:MAG: hypothetical protein M3R15_27395 [Acidobacteriota bacterium]|nr:hypothetical protein [Acidobacteriota bacterium]